MIIFNLDALARSNHEFGARLPDKEGMRLWHDLHQTHLGRLAVVVNEAPSEAILEHWLKINGVKAALYEVLDTIDPVIIAEKVQRMMFSVGINDWYIDSNPRTVAHTIRLGIPSILLANPYIMRPEWAQERPVTPWNELVEEMDSQAALRAERGWSE